MRNNLSVYYSMETGSNITPPTKMEIGEYITTKLYPLPYVNSKGYRIGNFLVKINKKNLPFSSFDQVDLFLVNLFNYAKKAPKDKKEPGVFNKDFLKNHKHIITQFKPIKYVKETVEQAQRRTYPGAGAGGGSRGGRGRKTNVRRKKSKKNRTRKVYSRKHK